MRARYVHTVTADDVGQRVTVRHGPVAAPSDVVGRLLALEDGVLTIIQRDHRVHEVPEAAVLASRVVPPHPRLPPEPMELPPPAPDRPTGP